MVINYVYDHAYLNQSISKSKQQFNKEHKINIMRLPLISSTIMSITYVDVLPHVLFSIKILETKDAKFRAIVMKRSYKDFILHT